MIDGTCDPALAAVARVFEENFDRRGEVGAAVCIWRDGKKLVDLWGGIADPTTGTAWRRDTIVNTQSVYKSLAALCVHLLIERGTIDIDQPVARYWPGFAQAGKAAVTVRQMLGGTAGLLYADSALPDSLLDWDAMIAAIERQPPEWQPGTQGAYHSMSAIFLFGHLVRMADGRTLQRFFADEIAGPLGADFHFGIGDAEIPRVAKFLQNRGSTTMQALGDRSTKLGRAWHMRPALPDFPNSEQSRRGWSGHGNARAVARIYAALAGGGAVDGVRLLQAASIDLLREQQWDEICAMTDRSFRYGLGFFLNKPPLLPLGPNLRAFGHPGAGGALGFADPENRIAFAYTPNYMCEGAGIGDRCTALIEAAYA